MRTLQTLALASIAALLLAGTAWAAVEYDLLRREVQLDETVCREAGADTPDVHETRPVEDGEVVVVRSPPGARDAVSYRVVPSEGVTVADVDAAGQVRERGAPPHAGCVRGDDRAPPEVIARLLVRGNGTLDISVWG